MNPYIVGEILNLCPDKIIDRIFIRHKNIGYICPSFLNNPMRKNFIAYMDMDAFNAKTIYEQFDCFTNVLVRIVSDGNLEILEYAFKYFIDINPTFHVTFRVCKAAIMNNNLKCYTYLFNKLVTYLTLSNDQYQTQEKRDEVQHEMERICEFISDTESLKCIDAYIERCYIFRHIEECGAEKCYYTVKNIIENLCNYLTYHGKYEMREHLIRKCYGTFGYWMIHSMGHIGIFTIDIRCLKRIYNASIYKNNQYYSRYFDILKKYSKIKCLSTKDNEDVRKIIECIRFVLTRGDYKPVRDEMKLFQHFNRYIKMKYHK